MAHIPLPPKKIPVPPKVPTDKIPTILTKPPEHYLFNRRELSQMFDLTKEGVKQTLLGVPPDGKRGQAYVWQLSKVAVLTADVEYSIQREKDAFTKGGATLEELRDPNRPLPTVNLQAMTPQQLKVYFQTLDVQQSYLKKKRVNLVDARKLIPKKEVSDALTQVFKMFGNFMDTLPDVLERDGLVDPSQIEDTIELTDRLRNELAETIQDFANGLNGS